MVDNLLVLPELVVLPVGAAPGVPVDEATRVAEELVNALEGAGDGVPDPPAAADSCANPIDGGLLLYTE